MKDKLKQIEFKVIDNNTGKEADIGKIALKEDWAKGLMYCDMQGFAILDDGNLVLLDECGKYEYCPSERFSIKFENSVVLSRDNYNRLKRDSELYEGRHEEKLKLFAKAYNQGSKETAEKILKEVDSTLRKFEVKVHKDSYEQGGFIYMVDSSDIDICVDELKNKFSVEIKE